MEQPIADFVSRAAPYALVAAAAALAYLSFLSLAYDEARVRVRAYLRRRAFVEALERHRPAGAPRSPRITAARTLLDRQREALVRDGILR